VILLAPGSYELRAQADVVEGGLELGVLDADADSWSDTSHFWHGQEGFESRDLVTPFRLAKPLRVRVIFSNWHVRAETSQWLIKQVWIRRA
jgi:hypothetical protein